MTTGLERFAALVMKGTALLGLSGLLLTGVDRLVGSLRRDVHAVLAHPPPASTPATVRPAPIRVAQAEPR